MGLAEGGLALGVLVEEFVERKSKEGDWGEWEEEEGRGKPSWRICGLCGELEAKNEDIAEDDEEDRKEDEEGTIGRQSYPSKTPDIAKLKLYFYIQDRSISYFTTRMQ
jgi:hypothetical protein